MTSSRTKKFHVNDFVVGATSYKAGAIWPYRFVACVWNDLRTRFGAGLWLEMNTAVESVDLRPRETHPYEVSTTRGVIQCNHVVHATNAFATQFIPGLRGKLTGFVGHMSAQRPGKQFPDYDGSRSWLPIYGKSFDYVTQRPTVDGVPGDVMLGGGFTQGRDQGMASIGVWDDSQATMDVLAINHISGIFPTIFGPNWGDDQAGGRIKKVWNGIVCLTGDMLPFVGRLDPKLTGRSLTTKARSPAVQPGEWISAGYCGDGMVWAWLCGTGLGIKLMGNENESLPEIPGRPAGRVTDWLPEELNPTLDRMEKADLVHLADHFA